MIIHAVSIHSGGGKVLLDQLLVKKDFGNVSLLICDTRYVLPQDVDPNLKIIRVKPSLIERWKAEYKLKKYTDLNPNLTVLCFSNLPPAFKLKANVILYLQNALLLPKINLYPKSLWSFGRLIYEKIWLSIFWKNLNEVWVQSNWMKKSLTGLGKPILIKPIYPEFPPHYSKQKIQYDFISVTGGAPHKRQKNLIDAWLKMSSPPTLLIVTDFIDPELKLLPRNNITILKDVNRDQIFDLYTKCRCLIITSKVESFCLPLYEAKHFNLDIMTPNEDYANEAVDAISIIDPENSESIIEEVMKYVSSKN